MEEDKQNNEDAKQRRSSPIPIPSTLPKSPSLSDRTNRHSRNKSVQWADWEINNAVDFSRRKKTRSLIDECSQTEIESSSKDGMLPLIDSLVQTSLEIGSITSRSRSPSLITCATVEEDEERQTALADLILHLEDTAALLREYLAPTEVKSGDDDYTKNEQTFFLLKYQILLVSFTQLVSILIFTLIDSLNNYVLDPGYFALTISCGSILQLLNIVLVVFASTVLSKQMVKYKVEGMLMAQTFIATVITFAGVYFLIFRFDANNWEFGSADRIEDRKAFGQFVKMLYLSVSSSTLCGAANVQPNKWHVTLIVCFQDLINFVYFASILAQTIGNYHSYTVQVRRSASLSHLVAR